MKIFLRSTFFFLVSFSFSILGTSCSCSTNTTVESPETSSDADCNITAEATGSRDDDTILSTPDTDTILNRPIVEMAMEKISWNKTGNALFYQWGTDKADSVAKIITWQDEILVLSNLNASEAYASFIQLDRIRTDDIVKTYRIKATLTPTRLVATNILVDSRGLFHILALTDGDFGKTYDKSKKGIADICLISIDPKNDSVSFLQWGNDNSISPSSLEETASGDLLVTGLTQGTFPNQTKKSHNDFFISKIHMQDKSISTIQTVISDSPFLSSMSAKTGPDWGWFFFAIPSGALPGQQFFGGASDVAIVAVDKKKLISFYWQFGTLGMDLFSGSFYDKSSGKIHFVGTTFGTFPGQNHVGEINSTDLFYGYWKDGEVRLIMQYGR